MFDVFHITVTGTSFLKQQTFCEQYCEHFLSAFISGPSAPSGSIDEVSLVKFLLRSFEALSL